MGLLQLLTTARDSLPDDFLDRVYMTGLDAAAWQSRSRLEGNILYVERSAGDSGNLHVPWLSRAQGEILLATATLMERDRPYLLEVELARGAINAIRNQLGAWQSVGLIVPAGIKARLSEAVGHFSKAATSQHQPAAAARHAARAIEVALDANVQVGESYTEQAMAVRRRTNPKLPTLFGVNLGWRRLPGTETTTELLGTFNAAVVPFAWQRIEAAEGHRDWTAPDKQIAWCQQNGRKIISGPLLRFDPAGVPEWSYLWEGDFDSIEEFMIDHVKRIVERYRGRVHLWQVASRVNFSDVLSLSEEERLRIVVRAIDMVRSLDVRTPMIVTFDQPWGECLAKRRVDLTPMVFADTLVRADLGLSGLGLEINAGYWPGGTQWHPLLDYSQLLDRWSMLGLPLLISLTAPSAAGNETAGNGRTAKGQANGPPQPCGTTSQLSPAGQAQWVESFVPLMLAKNCIQVVVWNQLHDRDPHEFPHGGLYDEEGRCKPAMQALRAIRQEYLT